MSAIMVMYEFILLITFVVKNVIAAIEGRIAQGEIADIAQYPHHVYLDIQGRDPCVCGGSILNQATVLTAAHCFEELDAIYNYVFVMYGSKRIDHNMKHKDIRSYIIHEYYNEETMTADIALAHFRSPIVLGRFVKKTAIMINPPRWKTAYVAGWGGTNENFDSSDILKHAKQEIQSYKVCKALGLPKGAFCAGPIQGPGTPSVGDSGGALVIDRYIQIGIVSYKTPTYTLVAYTNVSYYYTWIYNNSPFLYCRSKNRRN